MPPPSLTMDDRQDSLPLQVTNELEQDMFVPLTILVWL